MLCPRLDATVNKILFTVIVHVVFEIFVNSLLHGPSEMTFCLHVAVHGIVAPAAGIKVEAQLPRGLPCAVFCKPFALAEDG